MATLENNFPYFSTSDLKKVLVCTAKESGLPVEEIESIVLEKSNSIAKEFKENGVVVIKGVLGKEKVSESVEDIWKYILSLPYVPEVRKKWKALYEGMRKDFWRDVSKEESKIAKEIYPMTGGFGALTRSPTFHLQTQWDIRQSPSIASIFANLLGTDELMVAIDRTSFKYPGQGESEFEHWDSNPWFWPEEPYEGVQGIVSLSHTAFFAVPGSNTEEFRKEFISKYKYSRNKNEYRIDKTDDPMKLFGKAVRYELAPGDLVIWSSRCLHQAKKNTSKKIRYAYFITYFPRNNPQPAVLDGHAKKKVDFLEDRLNSYKTGKNPIFFPSGIEIRLYSRRAYMGWPDKLNKFCDMFTTGCEERTYGEKAAKAGQKVRVPMEWNPLEMGIYTPPKLTKLGKYLLGEADTWR